MNGPARRLAAVTVAACVVSLLSASAATAATVPLVGVTATAGQGYLGGIAATIDGNLGGGGWGLGINNEWYNPQTAFFTTAAPLDASDLYFSLVHGSGIAGHSINEFRISVTDSAVADQAANWTQLTPSFLGSTSPVVGMSTLGPSNRVRVTNNYEGSLTYGVTAPAPISGITGFRLEIFPFDYNLYDALPATVGRSPSNGNLVLTEFQVNTSEFSLVNVALGKPTTGDVVSGYPTSNGNDGNYNNFTHANNTNPPPNNPFWQVDLQGSSDLTKIVLYDRAGCCADERMDDSVLTVYESDGTTVVYESDPIDFPPGTPSTPQTVLTLDNGGAGFPAAGVIRIDGARQYFQFAELEALVLPGIAEAPPANLALGRMATASAATYTGYPASLLTNGNVAAATHPDAGAQNGFYYEIDMGETITFDQIDVFGRLGCCPERLSDYRVNLLDANFQVTWEGNIAGVAVDAGVDNITADMGIGTFEGRFIHISNNSGMAYNPQIAEVEAFGVPEPGSLMLLILGALGLAVCGARRRR